MKKTFRLSALVLVIMAAVMLAGCDKSTYVGSWVAMGVDSDGKPVQSGIEVTFNEDNTSVFVKDGVIYDGTWGPASDAETEQKTWKSIAAHFDGFDMVFVSLGQKRLESGGLIYKKKETITGSWRSTKIVYNKEVYDEARLAEEDKMIYLTFFDDGNVSVEGGGRSTDEATYEFDGLKVTFISVSGVNKMEGIYKGRTIEFKRLGGTDMDITFERTEE